MVSDRFDNPEKCRRRARRALVEWREIALRDRASKDRYAVQLNDGSGRTSLSRRLKQIEVAEMRCVGAASNIRSHGGARIAQEAPAG